MTATTNAKILAIYTESIIETLIADPKVEIIGVHTDKHYRHHKQIKPDIRAFTTRYELKLPIKEAPLIEGMEKRNIIRGKSNITGFLFLDIKEKDNRIQITAPKPIINYIRNNIPLKMLEEVLETLYKSFSGNPLCKSLENPYCYGSQSKHTPNLMIPVGVSAGFYKAYGLICPKCLKKLSFRTQFGGVDTYWFLTRFALETGLTHKIRVLAGEYDYRFGSELYPYYRKKTQSGEITGKFSFSDEKQVGTQTRPLILEVDITNEEKSKLTGKWSFYSSNRRK